MSTEIFLYMPNTGVGTFYKTKTHKDLCNHWPWNKPRSDKKPIEVFAHFLCGDPHRV